MPLSLDAGAAVVVFDLALTALLFWWGISQIRGTRAWRLAVGVAVLYLVYLSASVLGLHLLSGILEAASLVGAIALIVVFGPELRRGLERLGQVGSFTWLFRAPTDSLERSTREIARAAAALADARQGALLVLGRESSLVGPAETGIALHADLSLELLLAIFQPPGALHDGAVIIRDDRIVTAGVVLPLSETTNVGGRRLGTRHRAALGISEQSDALVVVVSEESGRIVLAENGRLSRGLDEEKLRTALRQGLPVGGLKAQGLDLRARAAARLRRRS